MKAVSPAANGAITRGHACDINALATMHGDQHGRGICDPELLMRARRAGVLLHACAVGGGAPRNLKALATMGGNQLEGVGADGVELELLVGRAGTTALHGPRAGILRAAWDFQAFLTMDRCEGGESCRRWRGWRVFSRYHR